MVVPVVSLPVPAVVGIPISGLSGPGTSAPLADRGIDVGQQVSRIRGTQVGDLGRVDARAAADADVAVELPLLGKGDGLAE